MNRQYQKVKLDLLGSVLLLTATWISKFIFPTFEADFDENGADASLAHPLQENTIPYLVLLATCIAACVVTAFICKSSLSEAIYLFLTLVEAVSLSNAWTQVTKVLSGRLRPDWYARITTGEDAVIAEGRHAFPSGHVNLAWASTSKGGFFFNDDEFSGADSVSARKAPSLYIEKQDEVFTRIYFLQPAVLWDLGGMLADPRQLALPP